MIVLTLTPELEVPLALLLAEAVALVFPAALLEGAGVPREDAGAALTSGSVAVVALMTVETVKSGGAIL